jgi:hypothetical protein
MKRAGPRTVAVIEDGREGVVERLEQPVGGQLRAGEVLERRQMPPGTGISPVVGLQRRRQEMIAAAQLLALAHGHRCGRCLDDRRHAA